MTTLVFKIVLDRLIMKKNKKLKANDAVINKIIEIVLAFPNKVFYSVKYRRDHDLGNTVLEAIMEFVYFEWPGRLKGMAPDSDLLCSLEDLVIKTITPKQIVPNIDTLVEQYITNLNPRPKLKLNGDLFDQNSQINKYLKQQKQYLRNLSDYSFLYSNIIYEGKNLVLGRDNSPGTQYWGQRKIYDQFYGKKAIFGYFNFFDLLKKLDFVPIKPEGPALIKLLKQKFKVGKLPKDWIYVSYKNILKHISTYHWYYINVLCDHNLFLLSIFRRIYEYNKHYIDVEVKVMSLLKRGMEFQRKVNRSVLVPLLKRFEAVLKIKELKS